MSAQILNNIGEIETLMDTINDCIDRIWKAIEVNADAELISVDYKHIWLEDAELVNAQGLVVITIGTDLPISAPGLQSLFENETLGLIKWAAGTSVKADFNNLQLILRHPSWRTDFFSLIHENDLAA